MVKPELGVKRVCPDCAIRFYDLLKNPIECPGCHATFVAEPILPSKNDTSPPPAPELKNKAVGSDDVAEVVSHGDDGDSGDTNADEDDVAAAAEIADIEINDDDTGDDDAEQLLEDDTEKTGNVSGFIDGVNTVKPAET